MFGKSGVHLEGTNGIMGSPEIFLESEVHSEHELPELEKKGNGSAPALADCDVPMRTWMLDTES